MIVVLITIVIFIVIWIVNSGIHRNMTPIEHAAKMIFKIITDSTTTKAVMFYPSNELRV